MKAEYVNPFLAPAKNVWQMMLNQELDLDEYATMSEQVTTEDITAIIRVKGLVEGHVLYGFDIDTAKAVAGVMMEEEVEEFDEVALSALGELVEAVRHKQESQQEQGQPQGQGAPQSDEAPLLPGSAELKLLKVAQLRINERTAAVETARQSGAESDESLGRVVEGLLVRQRAVAEAARDMRDKTE